MKKEVVQITGGDDYEIYAREGYGPGSPAVKAVWGFSTGSSTGIRCFADTFAYAELGKIGEGGDFESEAWTDEDFGKAILTKRVIGWPKEYEGWDPEGEDVDWDAYATWIEDYCARVL